MKYFPTQRQGSVATGVQLRAASAERQQQNTTRKAAESSSAFFELRFREYIGLKRSSGFQLFDYHLQRRVRALHLPDYYD